MWRTGLAAPQHLGSSRTRDRTRVPCVGRRIPNHCTTREVTYHGISLVYFRGQYLLELIQFFPSNAVLIDEVVLPFLCLLWPLCLAADSFCFESSNKSLHLLTPTPFHSDFKVSGKRKVASLNTCLVPVLAFSLLYNRLLHTEGLETRTFSPSQFPQVLSLGLGEVAFGPGSLQVEIKVSSGAAISPEAQGPL